ncbi:F21J9.9 [Salix koriyanagi]|uniref:F21J9.9 n=1 Tax=Salix koriyanagi TaxID=2511006 RepID=A0A9Q0UDE3_9ROSI|nr:F21J9.9 [Salix koriyanagi]
MDISIISKELIKPTSPSIHHLLPFKLSLMDQLFPTTYIPMVFFYPANNSQDFKGLQISTQLRRSLSQTLSTFYPLSGRVRNNSIIESFEKGAPFVETRVKGSLFDFLKEPQLNLLNKFLPCQPFGYESNAEETPQVAIQVNTFDCGGTALGLCFSHKIIDGATAMAFLDSWAANTRGHCGEKINPCLFEASSRFLPQNELLVQLPLWVTENYLFKEGNVTRRFVFDADAIATLKDKAKSKRVPNPSRTEALTAFIWKSYTEACRSLRARPRPSVSIHTVNIRQRTKPMFSRYSIGNLWRHALAACELADTKIELNDLVSLTRESFTNLNYGYLKDFEGENGFQGISRSLLKQLVEIGSRNPEIFLFSSWLQFDLNDVDFGWGKPIWVGLTGEVGRPRGWTNVTFFKQTGRNNEVEVWMTLDEKIMSVVERNDEFCKFSTPNPSIFVPHA